MNSLLIDMLSIIKNGYHLKKKQVKIYKFNNFSLNVLNFLYRNGYILTYNFDNTQNCINIFLKYYKGKAAFSTLYLISKVHKNIYVNVDLLSKYQNSLGTFVISTSKGILNLEQALKLNIGGKLLFYIF